MPIQISSGAASVYLQSILNNNTTAYGKSMEQLSSGSKFTSVGDDPVGATNDAKLDVKISTNSIIEDNVSIGFNLLSLAEDTESAVMENLQRIRDLTLQIANEVYSETDRDSIISEIKARIVAVDYVADSTSFLGAKLLDGSSTNLTLQIGPSSAATLNVGSALIDVHASQLGGDITLGAGVTGATWTEPQIMTYLGQLDDAMEQITQAQGEAGGYLNRLEYTAGTLDSINENLVELQSIISDVDVAEATTELVKYQVLQEASANVLNQTNQVASWALKLLDN